MNKVILMGRLVKEPEVRYSQGAEPIAVARYTLAVNRRFKRQGEPEADFINCVAFGKAGEFAEKYFKKGQMVSVVGRLQVRSCAAGRTTKAKKRWSTDVIVEEQYFAESKKENGESKPAEQSRPAAASNKPAKQMGLADSPGFYPIDETVEDDDLPF